MIHSTACDCCTDADVSAHPVPTSTCGGTGRRSRLRARTGISSPTSAQSSSFRPMPERYPHPPYHGATWHILDLGAMRTPRSSGVADDHRERQRYRRRTALRQSRSRRHVWSARHSQPQARSHAAGDDAGNCQSCSVTLNIRRHCHHRRTHHRHSPGNAHPDGTPGTPPSPAEGLAAGGQRSGAGVHTPRAEFGDSA